MCVFFGDVDTALEAASVSTAGVTNRLRKRGYNGIMGGFVNLEPNGRLIEMVDLGREFRDLPIGEHSICVKWRIEAIGTAKKDICLGSVQTVVIVRVKDHQQVIVRVKDHHQQSNTSASSTCHP